jgi:peptidoglycan/LPS O-acetylase OafA/YrhL
VPTVDATTRKRLIGLDGIRGLAALFVVVNHTYLRSFGGYPRITAPWWAGWFIYGRFAVVLFIVLSGFSLAVSPARTGWQLDSVGKFARRRAWRIVPPYWAALTFSLLVAWLIIPQPGQPAPTLRSIWVNGLLLQDVFVAPSPNRAFWTIAIEAQLYFAFPLLLLLVRRLNGLVMAGAVMAVVLGVGAVLTPYHLIYYAPDFAALFALGVMAAGVISASRRRQDWPWHWLALAAAVPVLAVIAWRGSVWTLNNLFWVDLLWGPAIACLLAAVATDRPVPLVRLLDTKPLRSLGSFSYSLYLTHAPIVAIVCQLIVGDRVPRGVPSFLLSLAIVLPLTVGFARLFGGVFEIPFQKYRSWPALRDAIVRVDRPRALTAPHR